jgi:2'-5' RNA ligase
MSLLRLFVAVDPDLAVRDAIARGLPELVALAPKARWVPPTSLHVTLVFLGSVDEERVPPLTTVLASATQANGALDLTFGGGGMFGRRSPRTLWAGVAGDVERLGALQGDVTAGLQGAGFAGGEANLDRAGATFVPHLTLARSRAQTGEPAFPACVARLAEMSFGVSRIENVVLYQSEPGGNEPRYRALAKLPLLERG